MSCCPFQIVTDELCGSFNIACGAAAAEPVYVASALATTGTVTVTNISDCGTGVTATINTTLGPIVFVVAAGNSVTRTASEITSVTVACGAGAGDGCVGKYCLNLHYGLPTGA